MTRLAAPLLAFLLVGCGSQQPQQAYFEPDPGRIAACQVNPSGSACQQPRIEGTSWFQWYLMYQLMQPQQNHYYRYYYAPGVRPSGISGYSVRPSDYPLPHQTRDLSSAFRTYSAKPSSYRSYGSSQSKPSTSTPSTYRSYGSSSTPSSAKPSSSGSSYRSYGSTRPSSPAPSRPSSYRSYGGSKH